MVSKTLAYYDHAENSLHVAQVKDSASLKNEYAKTLKAIPQDTHSCCAKRGKGAEAKVLAKKSNVIVINTELKNP